MYSVSTKNLTKSFDKTAVLSGISLDIAAGEFFFLLGPSGCGKTTLLRMLAGLEQPDKGAILFNGADVTNLPAQKRNASMVFQNYALWPHMTVEENVAFGLQSRSVSAGETRTRVAEVLELVRMTGYGKRTPGQLSGGQQQRIALARALVVKPELLLLDEPLSNLDARLRSEMRIELARVRRETGVTAVYVTHDQTEALSLADRIAFMDDHTIIQLGAPRELYCAPRSTKTARFLGNANLVPGTVKSLSAGVAEVETGLGVIRGVADDRAAPTVGTAVTCFFRPEKVTLLPTDANAIPATVISAFYQGDQEHLYLDKNGTTVQALIPAPVAATKPGSTMTLHIGIEDVRILLG